MNSLSTPATASRLFGVLVAPETTTLPRNSPGDPGTAGRSKVLSGVRTVKAVVDSFTESLSLATCTGTLARVAVQTPPAPHWAFVVQGPAANVRHFAS